MWANLSKLTPELSPEQQAIQVFLEQRMQAQGLQDPQDLGGLVVNLEFGNVGLEEDVVQAIVGDNPPVEGDQLKPIPQTREIGKKVKAVKSSSLASSRKHFDTVCPIRHVITLKA